MARLIVFDFDGTITDAEAEGAPYRDGYLADVAILTGQPRERVMARAVELEAELAAHAQEEGWVYEGRIVAPATVDPYLRVMPVSKRLFDEAGRFFDPEDRARIGDLLYASNYRKTLTRFRPGARALFEALAGQAVYIVTNSHTDAVQGKVRTLGENADGSNALGWLVDRVHGQARKFKVDERWTAVPASLTLPGLGRPVLLRRQAYFERLDALRQAAGADWSEVEVYGDIFELDLALPLALGARVGLMRNAHTPPWEVAYLADHPRGAVLDDLSAISAGR